MPTYEYRCQKCGKSFEHVHHVDEHGGSHPHCPKCRSTRVRQEVSGFYARTARKS